MGVPINMATLVFWTIEGVVVNGLEDGDQQEQVPKRLCHLQVRCMCVVSLKVNSDHVYREPRVSEKICSDGAYR